MPVKGGAVFEVKGVVEPVNGKVKHTVHILQHIAQGVGGHYGDLVFGKGVFLYSEVVDGNVHGLGVGKRGQRKDEAKYEV